MDIRQLQYLVALAREKHFTRAADRCNVTQPTLSGRIRQLEQELGLPVVERGHRYQRLTPEGERILHWAHRILDDFSSMEQELNQLKGRLNGRLVLGVIPSALPMAAVFTDAVRRDFPEVRLSVLSRTSVEIQQALVEHAIDAGLTYLDNEPLERVSRTSLYTERYSLFVGSEHPLAGRRQITWTLAAAEPLVLLTPDMQNRRIIDAVFRDLGEKVVPAIETNSVINAFSQIRVSRMAAILPEYFVNILGRVQGVRAIALVAPQVDHDVGLVILDRDQQPPLLQALVATAQRFAADANGLLRAAG